MMRAISQTAAGNPENQDRSIVLHTPERTILAVADGAGGQSGAARAAELGVAIVRKASGELNDGDCCKTLLSRLDLLLFEDIEAGETTCAIAVIAHNQVFGASVGDSGVWVITSQGHIDLSAHQSRKPLLGSGSAAPVCFSRPFQPGQRLLLATDGLLKYTSAPKIVEVCFENPEISVQHLLDLVRYPSGAYPDDVTIILVSQEGGA